MDMALMIWFLTVLGLYPSAVNAFFNVVNCKFNCSLSEQIRSSTNFSQALRYKRICSDKEQLNLQLTTLKNAFTALGYKPKTVKNQIIKAMSISENPFSNIKPN